MKSNKEQIENFEIKLHNDESLSNNEFKELSNLVSEKIIQIINRKWIKL